MLLLVPGGPGEFYLDWRRVAYGVAPTVLSIGFLILAGWFWSRSGGPVSLGTYVQRAFLWAIGLVVLFWVGLIVVASPAGADTLAREKPGTGTIRGHP